MSKKQTPKFIFVMGGVMSGVGKGVACASIGKILQSKGYRVTLIKIDQYLNVDAGTMNPTEHGEVFVTDDGDETDQDLGNYERFLGQDISSINYMTSGRIYQSVIQRERNLGYGGKCVEAVPHIPEEIIRRIKKATRKNKAEITVIEIGGTTGEYQNIFFLEAARMMHHKNPEDVLSILVSYLPIPSKLGEMKSKPTQQASKMLKAAGIKEDFIMGRSDVPIDNKRKEKLALFCDVKKENVISAPDVESIYDIPLNFEKEKLGEKILNELGLKAKAVDLKEWRAMVRKIKNAKKEVKIGVVGKYFDTGDFTLADSYISVIEAVKHGSWPNNVKPILEWISTQEIKNKGVKMLSQYDGVIIPQGWGSRGSEEKIKAIQYLRVNKIPYLGLCYGMQMAVIEFARNVCRLKGADSAEINPKTKHPVIHIMPEQEEYLKKNQYGGTIRLGAWPCKLKKDSVVAKIYGKAKVSERHRHRYEFNEKYRARMEKKGLTIAGTSPDGKLVECISIEDHPFFVGTQFHPEYKSRPLDPHPLFAAFIKACLKNKKTKNIKKAN